MTSPVEIIQVECPDCGVAYNTCYRASINLTLDPDFDDEYIREISTGTCPLCKRVADLGTLIVDLDGFRRLPAD